jgi:hypothetical protein
MHIENKNMKKKTQKPNYDLMSKNPDNWKGFFTLIGKTRDLRFQKLTQH